MNAATCSVAGAGTGTELDQPQILPPPSASLVPPTFADIDSQARQDEEFRACLSNIRLAIDQSRDTQSESSRPSVRGMASNVQFMTHDLENEFRTPNMFEIQMCTELVKHLLAQGYGPQHMVILTTSFEQQKGMIEHIRNLDGNDDVKCVHVERVTNFLQANYPAVDIILLSLSSMHHNPINPFLCIKLELLTNVQLIEYISGCIKKKRLGCYIFGNASIRTFPGELKEFCTGLADMGSIGNSITLRCGGHKTDIQIRMPMEIAELSPFGGCTNVCLRKLPWCDHLCPYTCHASDPDHVMVECKLVCANTCEFGHPCEMPCGICGPCIVDVPKKCPTCGRIYKTECCRRKRLTCDGFKFKTLECGHEIMLHCGVETPLCKEVVVVQRRLCTHTVTLKCHQEWPFRLHDHEIPCNLPCERACGYDHKCLKKCSEPCNPCEVIVEVKFPDCEHMIEMKCQDRARDLKCQVSCESDFQLDCGHTITAKCYQLREFSNKELAQLCIKPCQQVLTCGHSCKGTCITCHQGIFHVRCAAPMEVNRRCGHVFVGSCENFGPCKEPCTFFCEHGDCDLVCGIPCTPCQEPCAWACSHHNRCTNICSEKCNREPCLNNCEKSLACCHPCVGYCGLPCPTVCGVCDKEKLMDAYLMGQDFDEKDRFIVLENCGHVLEVESLKMLLTTSVEHDYPENQDVQTKKCPFCRSIIWNCRHFSEIIYYVRNSIMNSKIELYGPPQRKLCEQASAYGYLMESKTRMGREFDRFYYFQKFLLNELCGGTDPDMGQFDEAMSTDTAATINRLAFSSVVATKSLTTGEFKKDAECRGYLSNIYDRLFKLIMSRKFPPSEHESLDISSEIQRASDMFKLVLKYGRIKNSIAAQKRADNPVIHSGFSTALNALLYDCAFNSSFRQVFNRGLTEMESEGTSPPTPRMGSASI